MENTVTEKPKELFFAYMIRNDSETEKQKIFDRMIADTSTKNPDYEFDSIVESGVFEDATDATYYETKFKLKK